MKMKKAKNTAAILAVMALTAGFTATSVQAETINGNLIVTGNVAATGGVNTTNVTATGGAKVSGNASVGGILNVGAQGVIDGVPSGTAIQGNQILTDTLSTNHLNSASGGVLSVNGVDFFNGRLDADGGIIDDLTATTLQAHESIQVGDSQNPLETTRIDGGSISTGELRAAGSKFVVDKTTGNVTTEGSLSVGKDPVTGESAFTVNNEGYIRSAYGGTIGGVTLNGGRVVAESSISAAQGQFVVDGATGAVSAANGAFTVNDEGYIRSNYGGTIGGVTLNGGRVVAETGISAAQGQFVVDGATGAVTAANGAFSVNDEGYIRSNYGGTIGGVTLNGGRVVAETGISAAQGQFVVDGATGAVTAANGDVTIDADGTTYVHAGRSELQVTEDQSVLRHADNGIIVNEDGVAVAGDFEAGNGAVKINKDGELWAGNGNFRVTGDGDVYSQNGKSQFQVTDNLVAMQYGTNNYVMVNEDGVSISGDLKLDGALDTGDLDADSLYVAGGKFTVDSDGTLYSQVGKSQLQVRGDYVGMNYGPNTSIGLNEDGVTIRGDVSVEDDLRIGDKIYFGNDGSFAMGNGAFSVDPDGQLSVGYGKATINKYGVITASNMYIGDSANENNRVVTKGELGQAVDGAVTEATEGAVKWDKDDSGNYTNSINGVGLEDGNVTADTVTTTGDVNVGGNLNVGGSLTVGGETVATGADVTDIKKQIGVNEDGSYKTIDNGAKDVITGINKNTAAIGNVTALKGTNANGEKYTNLTDAVNGNYDRIEQNTTAIAQNSQAINSLGHRVSDLGDEIDSVGAISAALAGLHPLDYDGTGSKFQISAAMGTYDGTQAAAIGGFYHFNRDVMMSIGGATSFEGDKKTAANIGVTFRVGEGASGKSVSDDVMARLEAMDQKIAALEQENKDLKNVLGAIDTSLSKEFPDVPANHWAYEAVTKLAGNDVVAGYPDGEFHGDRTMTRYEMAEIIYKAMSKGVQVDQKLVNEFKPEMEQVAANQNA